MLKKIRIKFKIIRRIFSLATIFLMLFQSISPFFIFKSVFRPEPVEATTTTVTTKSDWDSGIFDSNKIDTATSSGDLKLKGGAIGSWSELAIPPSSMMKGSSAVYVQNTVSIFFVQGGTRIFWKYNILMYV